MSEFPADQLDTGGNIPPLIRAARLNRAAVVFIQVIKVIRLKKAVTELGKRNPVFTVDPTFNRVLREHGVDNKMLPDTAEKIDQVQLVEPISVVHDPRGVGFNLEIEKVRTVGNLRSGIGRFFGR